MRNLAFCAALAAGAALAGCATAPPPAVVTADGRVFVVTDNDALDDATRASAKRALFDAVAVGVDRGLRTSCRNGLGRGTRLRYLANVVGPPADVFRDVSSGLEGKRAGDDAVERFGMIGEAAASRRIAHAEHGKVAVGSENVM